MEGQVVEVSDMVIVVDRNGHLQAQHPRKDSWTCDEQEVFLDWIAATCNVRLACEAVGRRASSAYFKRRNDLSFANLWDEALDTGRAALHTMLIARARGMKKGDTECVDDPENMDTDLAFKVLRNHPLDKSHRQKGGPRRKRATREETDTAILKKLTALGVRIESEASR